MTWLFVYAVGLVLAYRAFRKTSRWWGGRMPWESVILWPVAVVRLSLTCAVWWAIRGVRRLRSRPKGS